MQSDRNKFARRADRNRKMAIEGHGRGGKKNHQQQRKYERDEELAKIRERMEELAVRMQ